MSLHVHVRRLKGDGAGRVFIFNRSVDWVNERVVEPWKLGEDMVLGGEHWSPRQVQVSILETADDISTNGRPLGIWNTISESARTLTDDLLDRPAGESSPASDPVEFAEDRRAVMVVHGRDMGNRDAMFELLRALDLRPLEWSELVGAASSGAPYIGDILDTAFAKCQAVVVISTPDDVAFLRPELVPREDPQDELSPKGQARPNVFFEAGMALGRFPTRTVLTELGTLRPASDLAGRHAVRLDNGPECRKEIAERLRTAGCEVNTQGVDWLSAGKFNFPDLTADATGAAVAFGGEQGVSARIDAFIGDLPGPGPATWTMAQIYNNLVEESGVEGIPIARQSSMSSRSNMTMADMRILLNQVKARLTETS
jgi:predicted nucleotide-binding protein